jgi:hypothetical protein
MHRKLIKDIIARKDQVDMEELECVVIELIDDLKLRDHDLYKRVEFKLYKMVHGEHLNEELATRWVSRMENKDGTIGEHWTKSQTDQYSGSYNKCDWYAAMNMAYSDYYNPKFDTNTYIDLAKDFLGDKDATEGKMLRYYMFVVCD